MSNFWPSIVQKNWFRFSPFQLQLFNAAKEIGTLPSDSFHGIKFSFKNKKQMNTIYTLTALAKICVIK